MSDFNWFRSDECGVVVLTVQTTELVNTAVLSERIVSWPMHVYLLTHTGRATDVTMQSSCHSQDEWALKVHRSVKALLSWPLVYVTTFLRFLVHSWFSCSTFFGTEPLESNGYRCHFCHPTNTVKALNGTQITDPSLSRRWTPDGRKVLHLCRLSSTS